MQTMHCCLTVCFDDPFWVALCERTEDGQTRVCRVVFGAEPKDCEVYAYFLQNFTHLRWSPPVEAARAQASRPNPKRARRAAREVVARQGAGTKAQQALKLQQEQGRETRRTCQKVQKEAEELRKFALRQQKRREKHNGH